MRPAISDSFRSIRETLHFDGIVRRHLEILTGAGIVAGLIYWMIAGRSAGAWREPRPPLRATAAIAVALAAAGVNLPSPWEKDYRASFSNIYHLG